MNARLALTKVVIVGLGGTGAYLLDLLTKTPEMRAAPVRRRHPPHA